MSKGDPDSIVRPRAHFYLKRAFLYYDHERVFLEGGVALKLTRGEWAVLECLVRGESELGVLARALAELEIGGEPAEIEETLVRIHSAPESVLEIGEPLDVTAPQVIVCSFSPAARHADSAALVGNLRRGGLRVAHVGLEEHVHGDPKSNVALERTCKSGPTSSPFQFFQWARSFVRFHTRAVLVLTGSQDTILFGDLAATHHSIVCVGPDWPSRTRIQDMLGADALVADPLKSLQSLFFAMRMSPVKDYGRLHHSSSSELAALALYGLRCASQVAYSSADHPLELERLGRSSDSCVPVCVPGSGRRSRAAEGPRTLAVVLDLEHFERVSGAIGVLHDALQAAGLERLMLHAGDAWFDVTLDESVLRLSVNKDRPVARAEVAVVFPGLLRHLAPAIDFLTEGMPTLFYPTEHPHPLLEGAGDAWIATARSSGEWQQLLGEMLDESSPRRAAVLAEVRRCVRAWNLGGHVRELVQLAERPPTSSIAGAGSASDPVA